jgi:hypothetical protein
MGSAPPGLLPQDTELVRLPAVPPAALHLSEREHALVYPLYAGQPPPAGTPLEDADLTDEEDTYDW